MTERMYEGYWQRGLDGMQFVLEAANQRYHLRQISRLSRALPEGATPQGDVRVQKGLGWIQVNHWKDNWTNMSTIHTHVELSRDETCGFLLGITATREVCADSMDLPLNRCVYPPNGHDGVLTLGDISRTLQAAMKSAPLCIQG